MSTTATPPIAPDDLARAARSVADIGNMAARDKGFNDAVMSVLTDPDPQSLFTTRTFWMAVLTPVVSGLLARYAIGLDPSTVGLITTAATTLAMMGMRLITHTSATVTGTKS